MTRLDIQLACKWKSNDDIFQPVGPMRCISSESYICLEQGVPSTQDLNIWQTALLQVYGISTINPVFHRPFQHTGRKAKFTQYHKWWWHQERDTIYKRDNIAGWTIWKTTGGRTRKAQRKYILTFNSTQHLAAGSLVASVQEYNDYVFFQSAGPLISHESNDETTENWALQNFTLPNDGGEHFAQLVREGTATTCGDGSFKNGRSTGGFTSFEGDDLHYQFEGANEVPVHSDDNMAYYGKLGGINGTISVANVICSAFNVTTGKITHGVDNQVTLTNCFGPDKPDTTTPGFNLVKKIRALIRLSGIELVGKKVKAHQDDNKEYDTLDPWAKANIKADKIAKDYLQEIWNKEPIQYKPTQHAGWNVVLNNKVITRKFEKNIILHCTKHNIQQYWLQRFSIPDESARNNIDWYLINNFLF